MRVGAAAAADGIASLILARRGPRLPSSFFRRGLDHRDVTRRLDVPQPELDRVEAECRRHFVHERFAREMDLRSDRIAQMRGAQRRGASEQRRDRFPRKPLIRELVGFLRHPKRIA